MPAMAELDRATRDLLERIGRTIRNARLGRRWSQRRLAAASGSSQSEISRVERGSMVDLTFRRAIRILRALDVEPLLSLVPPRMTTPPIRDRAHARCVGTVARRLAMAGWTVATEVAVGGIRWRGFIDILAIHPVSGLLLIIEVKTELDDLGGLDRQIASYLEVAWGAASGFGWHPRGATAIVLLLATRDNDHRLRANRDLFDASYALRSSALWSLVSDPSPRPPPRGARGLAMIDPASRRRIWLIPTAIDGRRSNARYADRAAFLARHSGHPSLSDGVAR
jgi:hypothetical protein